MHISKKGNCIKIKVIAIGIGDALNHPIIQKLPDVEFIFVDTEAHAIEHAYAETKLQTGIAIACASDFGMNQDAPDAGKNRIRELLHGADIVFIVADMEADAGTELASLIAEIAKGLGIFTIAVLGSPLVSERKRQMRLAGAGIAELGKVSDSVIIVSNQKSGCETARMKSTRRDDFRKADDVSFLAVRAINELVSGSSFTCFDLPDVKSILCGTNSVARMAYGTASGKNRAIEAAKRAISHVDIPSAQGVLILISGTEDMLLDEYNQAVCHICDIADGDANIMCGMICDDGMGEELGVTVIAR